MKKSYIMPATAIITIATQHFMAGSIGSTSGVEGLEMGGGTSESGITTGGARRSIIWDDDVE